MCLSGCGWTGCEVSREYVSESMFRLGKELYFDVKLTSVGARSCESHVRHKLSTYYLWFGYVTGARGVGWARSVRVAQRL